MNQHFFLFSDTSLPRLPHVLQGAEGTGDSGLKCIIVRVEEKKALEEYNCSMVPVSSEGAPGRRRHHCGALCSCAGRSRRRVLQGRASNNTSRNEALFEVACIVTSFAVGLLLLRGEGVSCSFPKRRHLSRPPSLSRTTPSEK